ncbi:MAG: amino acid permease [Oligoflexales bacterium]
MREQKESGGVLGSAFIICGSSIGGGMLALPSISSSSGFYPSLVSNIICWLFTMLTGLFLMDVCIWSKKNEVHLSSIAENYLGKIGKYIVILLFLFLYECLLVSYFSGGVPCFQNIINSFFTAHPMQLPETSTFIGFGAFIFVLVALGTAWIDRVNFLMMIGLVVCFLGFVGLGSSNVESDLLNQSNWKYFSTPIPIMIGAYGFHNVIPSLVYYLKKDRKRIKQAIVIGTLIPLVVYSIWQWLTLGSVPSDILQSANESGGIPIIEALFQVTHSSLLKSLAFSFTAFAIITSLVGVSFSMVDFLGDTSGIRPHGINRVSLSLATVLPPLTIAYSYPNLFVTVFGYAAGFGEALLNGLFPIITFWIACYKFRYANAKPPKGGKFTLGAMIAFTFLIIALEFYEIFST